MRDLIIHITAGNRKQSLIIGQPLIQSSTPPRISGFSANEAIDMLTGEILAKNPIPTYLQYTISVPTPIESNASHSRHQFQGIFRARQSRSANDLGRVDWFLRVSFAVSTCQRLFPIWTRGVSQLISLAGLGHMGGFPIASLSS